MEPLPGVTLSENTTLSVGLPLRPLAMTPASPGKYSVMTGASNMLLVADSLIWAWLPATSCAVTVMVVASLVRRRVSSCALNW